MPSQWAVKQPDGAEGFEQSLRLSLCCSAVTVGTEAAWWGMVQQALSRVYKVPITPVMVFFGGRGVFDEPGYPSSSRRLTLTGIALVVVCPAFAEDHSLGL